jgi:hypothetical protein
LRKNWICSVGGFFRDHHDAYRLLDGDVVSATQNGRQVHCLEETLAQELGCTLTFALEAKFEIEAKISFRLEAKKKPDFT